MKRILALGAAALLGLGLLHFEAKAQGAGSTSTAICIPTTTTSGGVAVTTCIPVTSTTPLPVTSTGAGVSSNLSQIAGVNLGGATAVGTAASGNVQTTNAQILGGAISNASSGVAVSTNNIGTVGYLYGFNGTTWDQLQVDGSKNLQVDINGCSNSTACNPNGQATMANSAPVVIASDQTSVHTTVDNFGTNPIAGFTPNGSYGTPLNVTGTSGRAVLPSGLSVDVANVGTQPAYINLGDGTVVATSSDIPIGGGQQICLTVGSNVDIAAISANGNAKTTLNFAGGTGACSGIGGSVTLSAPPNDVSAGPTTFTTTNLGTVAVSSQGSGSTGIQVTGAGSSYTINFEATVDNTNWFAVNCFTQSGTVVTSTTTTGNWVCPAGGYQQMRANLAVHASGTIAITVNASNGSTQHPVTSTGVAVSIANGADVALGSTTDAAGGTGTQTAISILKQLHLDVTGAIPAGSNTIGALTANQSVNVAQINGVTPLMGNGTTGTGSPRVTISSDNSAVSGLGAVATGAAPPANAIYLGANASGATGGHVAGLISCDSHVFKHITSATDTVAVQGVASQTIYVCSWRSRAAGVATWYLENTASANNNCSSSNTQLTGVATEAANTGETWGGNFWSGLKNTSGNGLCINSTGTGGVDVDIWYTQF